MAICVGLGLPTTLHLARTEGVAALCLLAGVVYVRQSVSCRRPLSFVFYLCAHPLGPPEKPP